MVRPTKRNPDFASLEKDEKAIVFGDVRHIENHDGTKAFSRRIGTYASQYVEYTTDVGIKIYSAFTDKGHTFWMPDTEGKDGDRYRIAAGEEIMTRIQTLFEEGGGKASKRRKKTKYPQALAFPSSSDDSPDALPVKAGDSVYAFDQLYRATVREIEQNLDGGYTVSVHWKGFRKEMDCDVSHLQILPVDSVTTRLYETIDRSERTGDHDDSEDDTSKPHHPVLNHRLFQGSAKRPRNGRQASATADFVTSATVVSPSLTNNNDTVVLPPLTQTIEQAKKKCDKIIQKAQSSDNPSHWKNGNVADWTKGILSNIEEHVPVFTDELEQEHEALVSQGLSKKFDASVAKAKLEKLKKVQKHLTALIQDLSEEHC
jgi:hypothetical protein